MDAEPANTPPPQPSDFRPPRPPRPPASIHFPSLLRELAQGQEAYRDHYDTTVDLAGDEMYRNAKMADEAAYFLIGEAAMSCITAAMVLARKQDVSSILDLPCGHGRVLRMMRARWPHARIGACDLLRKGVDFCASQFGAIPIYSDPDPAKIPTDEQFDLIWSGSLLTHLDAPLWQPFLRFFTDHLAPDGLLVFSTLGRFAALYPPDKPRKRLEHIEPMRATYLADGFVYLDQTDLRCPWHSPKLKPGYGLTWASPTWVIEQMAQVPELRILALWERGWNEHHDVVIAMKRPLNAPRRPLLT